MRKGLLFIAIVLGIVISVCISNYKLSTSDSPVYKSPVYKIIAQNTANGVTPVEAGKYMYYQLSVPSQASISGDYTICENNRNDIVSPDETAYANWISGHNVQIDSFGIG